MVVSAAALKEMSNGYEKRSNGLLVHSGHAIFANQSPTLDPSMFTKANIELKSPPTHNLPATPGNPAIGFHEPNIAAATIYKKAGTNQLRIQQNDGADFPIAGAAGSAQQQLVSQVVNPTWSTTTTGSWVLTSIAQVATAGSGLLRFDASINVTHSAANAYMMMAVGWDNAAQMGMGVVTLPLAGYPGTISGVYYATVSGTHTFQLFVLNYTAGTLSLWGGVQQRFFVTEQKI